MRQNLYLPKLSTADQTLHSLLNKKKLALWEPMGVNGRKKKNQCVTTFRLSPGSLWCTSSTGGNRGTPWQTGWNCRQNFHPGSSCPVRNPWPSPVGVVPAWRRAWPGGEDAEDAWLWTVGGGRKTTTQAGEDAEGKSVREKGREIVTGLGSCSSWRSALCSGRQSAPLLITSYGKCRTPLFISCLFSTVPCLSNSRWLIKRPCLPFRCCLVSFVCSLTHPLPLLIPELGPHRHALVCLQTGQFQ